MIAAMPFRQAQGPELAEGLPLGSLPEGLRFDGIQECGADRNFLQFTELDEKSPSYGASFYIDSKTVLLEAVIARREDKRVEFAAGLLPQTPAATLARKWLATA